MLIEDLNFKPGPSVGLEQIPPKLKTLAIRICSNILIWRESLSAKQFHFAGTRASVADSLQITRVWRQLSASLARAFGSEITWRRSGRSSFAAAALG